MEFFHDVLAPLDITSSDMDGHDCASPWPSDRDREGSQSPAVHL